ncbi:hypothetical protein QJU43_05135 [Pasteurella atlantica]|uniref:hypothetical protein n=1 Tax=Pasteurellaceae TaxID=712 RepID=UPI00275C80C0|nr:hypothetical protein [Pasteurella atlantica]MDP8034269.1 hypothetical protein [Pasteurella atlantica]MDP8036202.1 hypothetical protein [Pasteurella atlantica]MDP8038152.1 hypothetical protein [Pasteurella atlantica]MDP8048507.1 hypothetical protein [Pasteurella atlantica]MDP8050428.1 hypothetical protein [Pasteurella atlantica]
MTKDELISKLDEKKVPKCDYYLDGCLNICLRRIYDGYCIIEDDGIWRLLYTERGRKNYISDWQSAEEAYDALYEEFVYQYKW